LSSARVGRSRGKRGHDRRAGVERWQRQRIVLHRQSSPSHSEPRMIPGLLDEELPLMKKPMPVEGTSISDARPLHCELKRYYALTPAAHHHGGYELHIQGGFPRKAYSQWWQGEVTIAAVQYRSSAGGAAWHRWRQIGQGRPREYGIICRGQRKSVSCEVITGRPDCVVRAFPAAGKVSAEFSTSGWWCHWWVKAPLQSFHRTVRGQPLWPGRGLEFAHEGGSTIEEDPSSPSAPRLGCRGSDPYRRW
jgi:hypothetical protein